MDTFEMIRKIMNGDYDDNIEIIETAIQKRMQQTGKGQQNNSQSQNDGGNDWEKFSSIKVGDTVRFNNRVNPKYMAGQEATVVAKKRKKISVKMKNPTGRFGSGPVTCPVDIIDVVPQETSTE